MKWATLWLLASSYECFNRAALKEASVQNDLCRGWLCPCLWIYLQKQISCAWWRGFWTCFGGVLIVFNRLKISFKTRITFGAENWTKVRGNDLSVHALVNIKIVFNLLVYNQNSKPKDWFRLAQFLAPAKGANLWWKEEWEAKLLASTHTHGETNKTQMRAVRQWTGQGKEQTSQIKRKHSEN